MKFEKNKTVGLILSTTTFVGMWAKESYSVHFVEGYYENWESNGAQLQIPATAMGSYAETEDGAYAWREPNWDFFTAILKGGGYIYVKKENSLTGIKTEHFLEA